MLRARDPTFGGERALTARGEKERKIDERI